jgi:hypothetical protein
MADSYDSTAMPIPDGGNFYNWPKVKMNSVFAQTRFVSIAGHFFDRCRITGTMTHCFKSNDDRDQRPSLLPKTTRTIE